MIVCLNLNLYLWGYSSMMLKITLYKNCVLNETYQNVFSIAKRNNKTILELYLERLSKYVIECENVYYENSGEIVFDYELISEDVASNIYEYNYMKVEQFDDDEILSLERYCFVNSIQIKNGCVYLDYKEDVWSSYIGKVVGINESYLSRTRYKSRLTLNEPIELPIEYDGNNKLDIYEVVYNSLMYVLVEVQLYEIVQGDEPRAYRNVKYYLVKGNSSTGYKQLATEIETLIADLEIYMTDQLLSGYNYEIGDVYILNADFDLENKLSFDSEIQLGSTGIYFKPLKATANSFKGITLVSETILNNYYNYSIGTFDKQIKIINNGTDLPLTVKMFYSTGNISIQMCLLNQIVDITSSFRYEIPVTSIRAEEFTQRKIQYNLEKQNMELQTDEGNRWNSVFSGLFGFVGGVLHLNFGQAWDKFSSALYKGPFYDWQKENNKLDSIIAPQYSNAKGSFGNSSGITNYYYGIFILRINPDNNTYVKNAINNTGYKVYHYMRDFNSLNIKTDMYNVLHYDYVRFTSIDIYGSFPREIAKILNSIFETGVKIWYDENMYYDNYVV